MGPKARRVLLLVAFAFVALLVVVLIVKSLQKPKVITQTGGDYTPYSTTVVLYNADNLYGALDSSDVEALRTQLASYAETTYGKGTYKAQVVGDSLSLLATNDNGPPSFWLVLKFDKKTGSLRVNADLSSGIAVFTLLPQAE